MSEAMLIALIVGLFVAAAFAWRKLQRRPEAEPVVLPSQRAAALRQEAASGHAAGSGDAGPAHAASASQGLAKVIPLVQPAPESAVVVTELGGVSCEAGGAVHGALPPFGRLAFSSDTLVYEAGTRVVAKAGGLDSGDGASTMQSLGSIERGEYRYTIARADLESVAIAGHRVTIQAAGASYVFEGIGPSAAKLGAWVRSHGLG